MGHPYDDYLQDTNISAILDNQARQEEIDNFRLMQRSLVETPRNSLFPAEPRKTLSIDDMLQLDDGQIVKIVLFTDKGTIVRLLNDTTRTPIVLSDEELEKAKYVAYIQDLEKKETQYGFSIPLARPSAYRVSIASPVRTPQQQDGLIVSLDPVAEVCTVFEEGEYHKYNTSDVAAYGPPVLATVRDDPHRSIALYGDKLVYVHALSSDGRVKISTPQDYDECRIVNLAELDVAIPDSSRWSSALAHASCLPGEEVEVDVAGEKHTAMVVDFLPGEDMQLELDNGEYITLAASTVRAYIDKGFLKAKKEIDQGDWVVGRTEEGFWRSAQWQPREKRYASRRLSELERIVAPISLERLFQAKLVERSDGWYVESEDGKNLGGPYETKSDAKERLQEVEYFKHQSAAMSSNYIPKGTIFRLWSKSLVPVFAVTVQGLPEQETNLREPLYLQVNPQQIENFSSALELLRTSYGVAYEHSAQRPDIKIVEMETLAPLLHEGNSVITIDSFATSKKAAAKTSGYKKLLDIPSLSTSVAWVELDLGDGRKTIVRKEQEALLKNYFKSQ